MLPYCKGRLASKAPTWDLLVHGQVAGLITDGSLGDCAELPGPSGDPGVHCEGRAFGSVKRVRLNTKTQHTLQDGREGLFSLDLGSGRD